MASRATAEGRPARGLPWWATTLIIAAPLVGLLLFGLARDPRARPNPLVGTSFPTYVLPTLDGRQVDTAEFEGRPMVVNLWASWCVPCRDEAPILEAIHRTYGPRGLVVLGINVQDTERDARAFLREFGQTFPTVRDATGRVAVDLGMTGVPETFLVSREGVIVRKIVGPIAPEMIGELVGEIL
jgi:cytochrome c biogenesis protein CcmG/thiol:disulfide interchange protein DsbE